MELQILFKNKDVVVCICTFLGKQVAVLHQKHSE